MAEPRTPRTYLRQWQMEDREPFAALNADPKVMEFFPSLLSRAESDAFVERVGAHFAIEGFGLWALEVSGEFAGFVGLIRPPFTAHFTPCVEIGWRLATRFWGKGHATEAAREALNFGFNQLGLREIVSLTVPANHRSRAVMERLGMHRTPADDFDHPRVAEGHPLRRHVLYRIKNPSGS